VQRDSACRHWTYSSSDFQRKCSFKKNLMIKNQ
jgi:hypothetical protein